MPHTFVRDAQSAGTHLLFVWDLGEKLPHQPDAEQPAGVSQVEGGSGGEQAGGGPST